MRPPLAQLTLVIDRTESNFDKACDEAYRRALSSFGIDGDGHSSRLPDWERSDSWIEVSFEKYTRIGDEHVYTFVAIAVKLDEE